MKGSIRREWILANAPKAKDKDEFIRFGMKTFGIQRHVMRNTLGDMRRRGYNLGPVVGPRGLVSPGKGNFRLSVDVSEIGKDYDEESKIIKGIKALGTRLIKDGDFCMELEVPACRWKIISTMPKYGIYKKELRGRRFRGTYWGSPEVIKELTKKIDMMP